MATLSRKTIAIGIQLIEKRMSRTEVEHFFYENDVPDDLVNKSASNKLKMLRGVFLSLEAETPRLLALLQAALSKLTIEGETELSNALMKDGFVVDGNVITDSEPELRETRTAVEVLIGKHENKLDVPTLLHHLREAENLFHQQRWDSSIGQCRSFVEQLLKDIARSVPVGDGAPPDLSRPVIIRQHLQDAGFFDEPERKKLVDGVYGFFSEEGSHPGISTQSAARVAKSILVAFAFYLLEKLDQWGQEGFPE